MDYVMMFDLINAIHNKKPAPMDCYDAAAWSAISALSEMSIARGGALVDFPDLLVDSGFTVSRHLHCLNKKIEISIKRLSGSGSLFLWERLAICKYFKERL